jgi:hypoxanthine phosphoribosyltransferase
MYKRALTHADLVRDCHKLAEKLPSVDSVWGIPRKGMLPATLLAELLQVPLGSISHDGKPRYLTHGKRPLPLHTMGRKLLIDEGVHTGSAMIAGLQKMREVFREVIPACVYRTKEGLNRLNLPELIHQEDISIHEDITEWDAFDHRDIENWMIDLDGILCFDPAPALERDKAAYLAFLESTKPKFRPLFRLGSICSWRHKSFLHPTLVWLTKHGIKFDAIHLSEGSIEDWTSPILSWRLQSIEHKAKHYRASKATLFVESCPFQAKEIRERTGRPVWSPGTGLF